MVVAGIDSATARGRVARSASPAGALGYEPDEVTYFSYAPDGGAYTPARHRRAARSTSARRLGDAAARRCSAAIPDARSTCSRTRRAVSSSQAFLTLVYDPADPSYPAARHGRHALVAAPRRARWRRSSVDVARARRAAARSLDAASRRAGCTASPTSTRAAVRDLAADSAFMQPARRGAAARAGRPHDDRCGHRRRRCPATARRRPARAQHTIVDAGFVLERAHRTIVTRPDGAARGARRARARPLPCRSLRRRSSQADARAARRSSLVERAGGRAADRGSSDAAVIVVLVACSPVAGSQVDGVARPHARRRPRVRRRRADRVGRSSTTLAGAPAAARRRRGCRRDRRPAAPSWAFDRARPRACGRRRWPGPASTGR